MSNVRFLPPKERLVQLIGSNDFFLWEYYGDGLLGRIQAWIFRSRIKALSVLLKQLRLKPRTILDVGCGPMFTSYALFNNATSNYIGVDMMHANVLKKYRDSMRDLGVSTLEVVKASADSLPLRDEVFDLVLCLDVLEHLHMPREATLELHRVVKSEGFAAISLPLENSLQRVLRLGFLVKKISGDPILKRSKRVSIVKTPQYHYVGSIESYDGMFEMLKEQFSLVVARYTPIGFFKAININTIHIFAKNR